MYFLKLQNGTSYYTNIIVPVYICIQAFVLIKSYDFSADPKYIKLVVGTTDLDTGGLINDVKSIHIHPDYNSTARIHDIAVIEVKKLLDLNYAHMIRMDERPLREDDIVVLTGFGAREVSYFMYNFTPFVRRS